MDVLKKKVPVREQDPKVRATNFEEVCLGYNQEEATAEASRCLKCKNAKCVSGCPVAIDIPAFIKEVEAGNIEEAAQDHRQVLRPSGRLRPRVPAGEPVRGQMYPRHQGRAYLHRKAGAFRGRLVQRARLRAGGSGEDQRKESRSHRFRSLQVSPAPATWPRWAMRSPFLRPFTSRAAC